ncbi:hypothetical protein MKEN_00026500 [Mycena kentingensis (nom. inval.)]|nr:hypothetical protein MKEN_00026500 [Mycena kentingensis (nom. inval.)]
MSAGCRRDSVRSESSSSFASGLPSSASNSQAVPSTNSDTSRFPSPASAAACSLTAPLAGPNYPFALFPPATPTVAYGLAGSFGAPGVYAYPTPATAPSTLPPPGKVTLHPPFSWLPDGVVLPPGEELTYTILREHPTWYLDVNDYIKLDGTAAPGAIRYPFDLEPPRTHATVKCTFCTKTYAGTNAKNMWRRHVKDTHSVFVGGRRPAVAQTGSQGTPQGQPNATAPVSRGERERKPSLKLGKIVVPSSTKAVSIPPPQPPPSSWVKTSSPPPPPGAIPPRMRKGLRMPLPVLPLPVRVKPESMNPLVSKYATPEEDLDDDMGSIGEREVEGMLLMDADVASQDAEMENASCFRGDFPLRSDPLHLESLAREARSQLESVQRDEQDDDDDNDYNPPLFGTPIGATTLAYLLDRNLALSPPPSPDVASDMDESADGETETETEPEPSELHSMRDVFVIKTGGMEPELKARLMEHLKQQFGIAIDGGDGEALPKTHMDEDSEDVMDIPWAALPESAIQHMRAPRLLLPSRLPTPHNVDTQFNDAIVSSYVATCKERFQCEFELQLDAARVRVGVEVVRQLQDALARELGDAIVAEVREQIENALVVLREEGEVEWERRERVLRNLEEGEVGRWSNCRWASAVPFELVVACAVRGRLRIAIFLCNLLA